MKRILGAGALMLALLVPSTTPVGAADVDVDGLIERGTAALVEHDFSAALEIGEQASAAAPGSSRPLGIVVDALVELGRYEEAGRALQAMLRARPDLSSYARLSYYHELHGRLDEAIDAMERALVAGGPTVADTEFARVQLGQLSLLTGDIARARALFGATLAVLPEHAPALAGLARVAVAEDDHGAAAAYVERAIAADPLPEHVLALADLRELAGDPSAARALRSIGLQLERAHLATAVTIEPYSAIVEADHGDRIEALRLARASYAAAPTIGAADALAWTLHVNGRTDEAVGYVDEALRTGSRDPAMLGRADIVRDAASRLADAR